VKFLNINLKTRLR